jgi:hypothetical protein
MRAPVLASVLGFALFGAAPAFAQIPLPVGHRIGPAVDLEIGGGRATAGHGWGVLAGVGLGVFSLTQSRVVGVTATASYVPWQPFAFGLAGAFAHVETGLGFGAGAHVTTHAVWGVHAGPSLSLLHLEGQIQFDDRTTKALVLFLRLPVGLIAGLFSAPRT